MQRVRTDPHSPNHFRVDGTVYNVPEFAKAFKCSADAKVSGSGWVWLSGGADNARLVESPSGEAVHVLVDMDNGPACQHVYTYSSREHPVRYL